MNFLHLTQSTASTARAHTPPDLTHYDPRLSPSSTANALSAVCSHHTLAMQHTTGGIHAHLDEVARFADRVCDLDSTIAGRLDAHR
ncbi:hypothetical protein CGOTT_10460 [Corynebacterium gottingense]|nr:hypothetical protein CGOTT_10460 [Corynebacterium gottingense]WJZ16304.1 hypothetical protein CGOTTB_10410 [Corynebacterium gottingense]